MRSKIILRITFCISLLLPLQQQINAQANQCGGAWNVNTPMPTARSSFATCVVNDKLYAFGGELAGNCIPISTVEVYDPTTNSWATKASMPGARWRMAAVATGGMIYLIGGQNRCGGAISTVEAYDPVTDSWTTKAPMPTARNSMAVGVINGVIYVAGGGNSIPLNTVEAYDPVTNTWTTKASMPTSRTAVEGAVLNNILYVLGGQGETGLNIVEAYDPATNSWTTKAPMHWERNWEFAAGTINGKIFVAGGLEQLSPTSPNAVGNHLEIYDPTNNSWTNGTDMPTPRYGTRGEVINNRFYVVGGYGGDNVGYLNVSEDFTPSSCCGPVITCPPNITINCDASSDPSNTGTATATDNCDPAPVISKSDESTYSSVITNFLHYNYTITRTWKATDVAGNKDSCVQTITVHDVTAPVISCPANVVRCYAAGGSYTVPVLVANDNCGINTITYQLTGATTGSSNGYNASGSFNIGITTITWTVRDFSGNSSTCQNTVTVDQQLLVTIPDIYLFAPGASANTIYVGYGPTSMTLNTNVTGGTAPYSYSWLNGASTSSIIVSQVSAGTYSYTVTVTDALGCTATVVRQVNVIDVQCGNKNNKVLVCMTHNGNSQTACMNPNGVPALLAQGASLGDCLVTVIARARDITEKNAATDLVVKAMPNPSNNYFTLRIESYDIQQNISLRILDMTGKQLESRAGLSPNQTIQLGQNYLAGIYIAVIIQGDRRRFVKLVKL